MPVERISKGFRDLSLTFKRNPLNQDLISIKNETAISRSIRNLILTQKGERFFNPNLGSNISNLLFESMSPIITDQIRDEILSTVRTYEPRVELGDDGVVITPDYEGNSYNITIKYKVIGIVPEIQEISFVLRPTR